VPVRRSARKISDARMPRRSGLAETIGMNEAALGIPLWGSNRCVVASRANCAANVPRALFECVPHVDVNSCVDMRHGIGKTLHGK
jgi:hypothetical protein